MPLELDFRTLTPADALDLAVLIEEEARQRYLELVDSARDGHADEEAIRFFARMARHEHHHGQELLERRERLYPDVIPRVNAAMLSGIETPHLDSPEALADLRTCLEAAMAAERTAEGFFRRALREAPHPEVRRLFEELAEEEVEHQKLVADQLARLSR
jgi:rubrerythrin